MKNKMSLLMLFVGFFMGCEDIEENRNYLNEASLSGDLNDAVSLRVQGASILNRESAQSDGFPKVKLRAQSFDVRIDLTDTGCDSSGVWFELTHLPTTNLRATYRGFIDGISATREASRSVLSGGITIAADAHDLVSTPLGSEDVMLFESGTGRVQSLKWTTCTRPGTKSIALFEGWVSPETCWAGSPGLSTAVCVESAEDHTASIGRAPLRVRHRIRRTIDSAFAFATWGNNASNPGVREAIIEDINGRDDISFAVISGDLTAEGLTDELTSAIKVLDERLDLPWYATLGDRDVSGPVATKYIALMGASSFAFDVGRVRILVPDSADRIFGFETRQQIDEWLNGVDLGWPGDPVPPANIVITHVPPFEQNGLRGIGFRSRKEAAAAIALLRRGLSSHVITSQLAVYRKASIAGVDIVHSGGAGAAIERSSGVGHHWLQVRVDPDCSEDQRPSSCGVSSDSENCPCITVEPQFLD